MLSKLTTMNHVIFSLQKEWQDHLQIHNILTYCAQPWTNQENTSFYNEYIHIILRGHQTELTPSFSYDWAVFDGRDITKL